MSGKTSTATLINTLQDTYVEGMDFTYDSYLITTLKKALAVLELQDEMFDNVTN